MARLDLIITHPCTIEAEDLAVGKEHQVGHAPPFRKWVIMHVRFTNVGGKFHAGR